MEPKPIASHEEAVAYREGYILGRLSVLRKIKKLSYKDLLVSSEEIIKEFKIYMKDYQHIRVLHMEDICGGTGSSDGE